MMDLSSWETQFRAWSLEWYKSELMQVFDTPTGKSERSVKAAMMSGNTTADTLAAELGLDYSALLRFLGAWIELGLVQTESGLKFSVSRECPSNRPPDFLTYLQENPIPDGASTEVVDYYQSITYPLLNCRTLIKVMTEGRSQFSLQIVDGSDEIFQIGSARPDLLYKFQRAFSRANVHSNRETFQYIAKREIRSLIDVGGGSGSFVSGLGAVMGTSCHVALADTAETLELFQSDVMGLRRNGIDTFPINFFSERSTIQSQFECVHLGWILHDWDDNRCFNIIQFCEQLLAPGGRLLVSESLLNPGGLGGPAALSHVLMLAMAGGTERTLEEYRSMFLQCGFNLTNVLARKQERSLMEFQRIG